MCEAYRETIERKLDQGLSGARIHQDLKREHGFSGSYHAVLEVDKAFYSAPPEYITRRVWVRWDARLVRVFNDRWQEYQDYMVRTGRFWP